MGERRQILAAILAAVFGLFASSALGATVPLSATIDLALRQGAEASIAPKVSSLLGLRPQPEPTQVRQLTARSGRVLRTFSVSVAHRHELVISTVDEDHQITMSYLLTVAGKLRKVVVSTGSASPAAIPRAHALVTFTDERDFWARFAGPPAAPR